MDVLERDPGGRQVAGEADCIATTSLRNRWPRKRTSRGWSMIRLAAIELLWKSM
jgi:hypothetical protein